MHIEPLAISGAWLIKFQTHRDNRGLFRELFKTEEISKVIDLNFSTAQANLSSSLKGALRGIHYSLAKNGQAKYITCVKGQIQDVIVDIRPSSLTFGRWIDLELNDDSGSAVFIEPDLGHGFLSLAKSSTVVYLTSSSYDPKNEFAINPFDPDLSIKWILPAAEIIISERDKTAPSLNQRKITDKLPGSK